MTTRLLNLRRAGFSPTGAIDGGAFSGEWTRELWSVWPNCPVAMIEPLPHQLEILTRESKKVPGSIVISKAIGKHSGEVWFKIADSNSGVTDDASEDSIRVPCTTLDELLEAQSDFKPNLLKLDLQGHELEALMGSDRHLTQFEVIIMEVSLLRLGDVPIFSEVDRFMETRGYRFYDTIPMWYRPLDGALWQMDAFYVRTDSALLASRSWA